MIKLTLNNGQLTITEEQEVDALRLMMQQGGGFASTLADAWFRADSGNKAKLRATFGDLLRAYVTP